ncbi:ubiquitin-binding protein cue5 [Coniochaeta pulveracea]|uniref:Ubiquitin-binding protein cue5 n=1 Tax=Coniochaeta pulveracea TaxID=177199 RepID=A0A420YHN5_9PEZI|nr:ubiquitin-binding protein cue5 [Coniochaeta pulveracea]
MSATTDSPAKAATVEAVPESPTTARPLEMDDDDVNETSGIMGDSAPKSPIPGATPAPVAAAPETTTETAPPKPPRPLTEQQKNEQTLKEAFPTIDATVIRAVLRASRGQVEPAFNALLEMTDPDAVKNDEEEVPPPRPPRPVAAAVGPTATPYDQLEADERYARQLAEQYEHAGAYEARTSSRAYGAGVPRGRQQTGLKPNELYDDREHSFLDDDLPEIKESLRKGFVETQTKVNSWFTNIKKKLEEQFDDNDAEERAGASSFIGRPTRNQQRRSADYDRYDADPAMLSDDFAGMQFNNDGSPVIPSQPSRANPHLFKPPPPSKSPRVSSDGRRVSSNEGRRVSFKESVEDIDPYNASPRVSAKDTPPTSASKASKWQPLSSVDPNPIADNDPFSLGDSDDERETKDKKPDDQERLRKAAAEAMADSLVDDKDKDKVKAGDSKD